MLLLRPLLQSAGQIVWPAMLTYSSYSDENLCLLDIQTLFKFGKNKLTSTHRI